MWARGKTYENIRARIAQNNNEQAKAAFNKSIPRHTLMIETRHLEKIAAALRAKRSESRKS